MLDQDVINLAKAIRQHETGNRAVKGASGEMASRYQYMPGTWKSTAAKYLGNANAPLTLENENKATYLKILDWKKAGYNPAQIASMWNSGSPKWEGKVGINKAGVKYDVPNYVNSVYSLYKKNKEESIKAQQPKISSTQQADIDTAKQYNAPFTPETGGSIIKETAKAAGNLPTSIWNFAKGVVNFLNPYKAGQKIGEAAMSAISADKEGVSVIDTIKELPQAAYETLFPEGIRAGMEGAAGTVVNTILKNKNLREASDKRLQEAQRIITSDPFAQTAPLVLGAEALKGKVVNDAISKTGQKIIEPIKKTAEAGKELANKTTSYAVGQATALKPETISEIINKPEQFSKPAMEQVNRGSISSKVWENIEAIINEKSETGKSYEVFRKSPEKVTIPTSAIYKILDDNGIKLKDGQIQVTAETKPMSNADISGLQSVLDTYLIPKEATIMGQRVAPASQIVLTSNAFLNLRESLSNLAKYDAAKTSTSAYLAREIRSTIDTFGKDQIKGLKDADASYSELSKEYKAIQKEYLTKDIATGEIKFKDGAILRIVNATNKGRESVLARLENISPGISKEIHILKAIKDIEAAGGNKVGAYLRVVPTGIGYLGGGLLGAVITSILSSPSVVVPLLRMFGESVKIKTEVIDTIIKKLESGKKLTESEQEIFYDMLKFAAIFSRQENE